MINDLAVMRQIIRNLNYDIMVQMVLLVVSLACQVGGLIALILYARRHRGDK